MDDLAASICATLDSMERLARLMPPFPWRLNAEGDEVLAADGEVVCEPFALSGNQVRNMAWFFVMNNPQVVLDLISAHREILAFYEKMLAERKALRSEGREDAGTAGALLALHGVVKSLAKCYGIEPDRD